MEAVRYTIDNYSWFSGMKNGIDFYGSVISESHKIDESKGIVDEYLPIAEELYNAICNENPVPFNDGRVYLSYVLTDYKMHQDCFIDTLTLVVGTKSDLNSNFRGDNSGITSEEYKMKGVKINIFIKSPDINTEAGKSEFFSEMSHELQHVYRFYCILLSNNVNYKDEEDVKTWRVNNAIKLTKGFSSETIQNNIGKLYYMSDRNEISSETNRLYEYIRTHDYIDFRNFHQYEEELPLFPVIKNLENAIREIDSNKQDKDFVELCGGIFNTIIGDDNSTPQRALMKLRTRLIDSWLMAKRNYDRTIVKAFKDFNRNISVNENKILREMIDWSKIEGLKGYSEFKNEMRKYK